MSSGIPASQTINSLNSTRGRDPARREQLTAMPKGANVAHDQEGNEMWNTGCNNIGNALDLGVSLLDGENQSLAITVPSKGSANWQSVIFPWCDNEWEVRNKAFRVSNIDSGRVFLYLFQEYRTDRICWSVATGGNPWDSRHVIRNGLHSNAEQVPFSALDIFIMGDRVWGLPASSQNQVFAGLFAQVLAVGNTVGAIAAAVAAVAAL